MHERRPETPSTRPPGPVDQRVADASRENLSDRLLPAWLRPYARLARWDRPIGWWLLLLPCWWAATLAADSLGRAYPEPWHVVLFLVGAIAMRGAGCTFNDIVDRDLDAAVARTRSRPIPSGAISARRAAGFLVAQAIVGLVVLLQFNGLTIGLGIGSIVIVALYPFLKRVTNLPQLGLGLAFSWGALVGWTAATGTLGLAPVLLYLGGVAWTVGYDTIYALQDKEDDALIGVGSSALLFGARARLAVAVCYGSAVVLWAGALIAAGVAWPVWAGLAAAAIQLGWQVARIDLADGALALRLFKSNRTFGLILLAGLLASAVLSA
ncbi:MAG: 4-hydroxybenzoate octaprenyltransferase [Bauldia sp.]|nr:4-hydroxybenzoate octaprenyltransferase [Bauldia sp.]